MAIPERYYHRHAATQSIFNAEQEAQRKCMRALNVDGDIVESEYWRGYAEGMDKAYEVCMRMFEAELEAHRSELEAVSNERDELVNRYRWRYWKS